MDHPTGFDPLVSSRRDWFDPRYTAVARKLPELNLSGL
jgi:hypothetical protein